MYSINTMGFKLPIFGKKNTKSNAKNDTLSTGGNTLHERYSGQILLGIDVGTRYIKSVVFQVSEEGKIEIIGYARVAQKYGAMRDAMIVNLNSVISACDLCVGKAIAYAERAYGELPLPETAILGVAGELVRGVSVIAEYERENPEIKIDVDEVSEVLKQVNEDTLQGALEELSSEIGVSAKQIEQIGSYLDNVHIDQTLLTNPIGFSGTNIIYRVFNTYAPKIHIDALYELTSALGINNTRIVVQPYAVAKSLPEAHDGEAIIIDIGGGTTDVAVITRVGVAGTKMFAFGGDVLTRRISEEFNIEFMEAEDLKLAYSDGELKGSQEKTIRNIVQQDINVWVEGVQISLEEIIADEEGDVEKLPSTIYLCGGGAALPEVREALLQYPWLTSLPFHKFPKVEYIYPNQLTNTIDLTRLLVETGDVTPASIARMLVE